MYIKKIKQTGTLLEPPVSEYLKSGCKVLLQNESVGEHITENREEILVILRGTATVFCEKEVIQVDAQSIVYIPVNKKHNVSNTSDTPLMYVYIVTPIHR